MRFLLRTVSNIVWFICILNVIPNGAGAFGKKYMVPPPNLENPSPNLPREPNSAPSPPPVPGPSFDWKEQSLKTFDQVDGYFPSLEEYLKPRRAPSSDSIDRCEPKLASEEVKFGFSVGFFISEFLNPQVITLKGIDEIYGVRESSTNVAVGLTSHLMCLHTSETARTTLRKNISESELQNVNLFARTYNKLREKIMDGSESEREIAKEYLFDLWARLFGCLGYIESLTTADFRRSYDLAEQYGGSDYSKPPGVKFYYDESQSNVDSKLNIGLYQFSPKGTGNISPCIDAWNERLPQCEIKKSDSMENFVKVLGSSSQHFNAFCGVHKILQTFHVQANTQARTHTHPDNTQTNVDGSSSRLKRPSDRCVTLNVRSGYAYNHFGPLQNSTGVNLNSLFSCALR